MSIPTNLNSLDPLEQLHERFSALGDPRLERSNLHELLDIITIAICAVICGADDWVRDRTVWQRQTPLLQQVSGPS